MDIFEKFISGFGAFLITLIIYSAIGTSTRVDKIRELAPNSIEERGWDILRYEGYQYGSWSSHGGKVWYHVRDKLNHDIQYRVAVVMWGDELHYIYGDPEIQQRVEVEYK